MRGLTSSLGHSPTRSPTWEELGPGYLLITGKLSWLPINGRTLITASASTDRAMQGVTENMVPYEMTATAASLPQQEVMGRSESDNEAGMLSSTPFPTSYNAVSRSKMLGVVLSTSFKKLNDSPVYTP